MAESFHCPRCNRLLKPAGDLTIEGAPADLTIYQCAECMETIQVEGESFETAFTFGVDAEGAVVSVKS